jgi:hypothetical protein
MSDTEQAVDAAAEEEAAAPEAVAVAEPVEAEPVHETPEDPVAAIEAEVLEEAIPVPMAAPARQAKILLCERGHRTVAVWSTPTNCHARPTRSGAECGRQLYPIGELPEQVQKALNPLKASKKASKG